MTTQAPVDVEVLREEIRKTYTEVSSDHEQEFIFPTGRSWATQLGYPEPELSRVPDTGAGMASAFHGPTSSSAGVRRMPQRP